MEITVEYHDLKLRCKIEYVYPTFEETEQGIDFNFDIESIKLEESEIDIYSLFHDKIDYIKLLIQEQL
jgi:hypothetical protein